MTVHPFAVIVGIDWADRKHDFCLKLEESGKIERGCFQQKSESIHSWVCGLEKRFPGKKIAIALEQARGGLIFALMKYESLVLYPIHPKTLSNYREAWAPSRAKDDPTDAALLMELIIKHPERFKAWGPEPLETRLLQRLTEQRVKLVNDLKRVGNRLTALLKEYFPQVLEVFPVVYRNVVADFILTWSTLEQVQKATEHELFTFFRSHSSGTSTTIQKRVAFLKTAFPLISDKAIIDSNALMAKALAEQLKTINAAIDTFEHQIKDFSSDKSDAKRKSMGDNLYKILGNAVFKALKNIEEDSKYSEYSEKYITTATGCILFRQRYDTFFS